VEEQAFTGCEVNLNVNEAAQKLIESAGRQIAGIS